MNIAALAKELEVHGDTIRRWCSDYRQFLSPTANPGKGQVRSLTRHDLAVMAFVAKLRKDQVSPHEIRQRLLDMQQSGWERLNEVPDEWLEEPADDDIPIALAEARAREIATIAALQTELTHVRTALDNAQKRAESLQSELDTMRESEGAAAGKIHALEVDLERARGEVAALEARLSAYAVTGDKPLSVAAIILVTALTVAVLLIVLLIVVRLVL